MIGSAEFGWLLALAGVLGLAIGSFLNVVIWRVPRGESLLAGSHCQSCDAPVRPWHNIPVVSYIALRGRCAHCGVAIGIRYPLIELGTAAAFVLITWWYCVEFAWPNAAGNQFISGLFALVAFLWFGAASIALTTIDAKHQRLPNAVVLPSAAVVLLLLSVSSLLVGDWSRLGVTLGASAALFALYFGIALVYPRGIGGGDVKLAPLVGGVLGYLGWSAVGVGAFSGFLFAALVGVVLMFGRRARWRSAIAYGPWMLIGAWVGLVWGDALMNIYIDFAWSA
ncbi:prepilin peptidase [Leucobacter denitrificans]|uniref:Prepilin peptidase n=1 Tax=Leucobacter denitrificans TaxID=683042 RepID=A0A7G9S7D2_9MICO|nr:A24 family peptidase [Leucobacter denitrificans]QNN63757.1 prepilin peptidase [Leucobacter denitrificans]